MQFYEADTIARWRSFVTQVQEVTLPAQGVRMVRKAGDALLIEADSAGRALRAAFALHDTLAPLNDGVQDGAAMRLRIGIHIAEVLVEPDDLQGAGTNLAARLATLGQPGETLLSDIARADLVDGLHGVCEDRGLRYVKGLDDPVRVFSARPAERAVHRPPPAPPLPVQGLRPAIAVVPFQALPADAHHDALGFAMADEIIATLARHPSLRVLSRHSTAALRGTDFSLADVHRSIRAPYLLSGHFHVFGQHIRLSAELCTLPEGEVLWAGTVGSPVGALFEGSDDLVPHIVANVAAKIVAHELVRTRSLAMSTLAPYTLYIGATGLMNSLVRSDFDHARQVFDHLLERHPRQAAPYAMLATWHLFRTMQGWSTNWQSDATAARSLAERALEIDPQQAAALAALGAAHVSFSGDAAAGRACYEAAIKSDPSEAWAWARLAGALSHVGEHTAACEAADNALTLSPLDPSLFVFESFAAMATLGANRYDDAVRHAQSSVRRHALHVPSHRLLTAALWLAGREEDARKATSRYLEVQPGASAGIRLQQSTGNPPVWRQRFVEALVAAGVPP